MLLQRLNIADEALARVSGSLKEQIRAVNSLMVNLLKIRKLSAISRKKETTLVAPVVQQVLEQNQRALAEKQLRVEVEIGQEATLPVDKEVLRVVLQNVLSNALKFSHAGGEIQVGWEAGALLIRDFGPGMAPALAARLTREAVPAADGTRNEQGSGMGLYLIGQLLHDSGIRLAFEAPKGGGTQVRIVPARP
jgi:signal transduction histidine kinase